MTKEYLLKLTRGLYRVTDRFPEGEPIRFALREKAIDVLTMACLVLSNGEGQADQGPDVVLNKEEQPRTLFELLQAIKALEILFALAREQRWVAGQNFVVLEREYQVLKQRAEDKREALAKNQTGVYNEQVSADEIIKAEKSISYNKEQAGWNEKVQPERAVNMPEQKARPRLSFDNLRKPRHRKIVQVLQKRDKMQVQDFKKEFFPQVSKRTLRRDMDYLLKMGFIVRKGDKNITFYKIKR